jgi:hypothetical protein
MTDKPVWRMPYDVMESAVAPRVEALVHSGQFATLTAAVAVVRRGTGRRVNGVAAKVWHLVNLPAGTDVQRLRVQIGALDRDVRRMSLQLDQQLDSRTGSERA